MSDRDFVSLYTSKVDRLNKECALHTEENRKLRLQLLAVHNNLKGAADYIDTLGGNSRQYRQCLAEYLK